MAKESKSAIATGTSKTPQMYIPDPMGFNTLGAGQEYSNATVFSVPEKDREMSLEQMDGPGVIMITSVDNPSDLPLYTTNKFFLQQITKPRMEKFQIMETFGESKLFFFGARTKIYSITGFLVEALNSEFPETSWPTDSAVAQQMLKERYKYRWSSSFQEFYDLYLRGSVLAEKGQIATLYSERALLMGYPLQMQVARDTNNPLLVQFQMTWSIYKESFLNAPLSDAYTTEHTISEMSKAEIRSLTARKKVLEQEQASIEEQFEMLRETEATDYYEDVELTATMTQQAENALYTRQEQIKAELSIIDQKIMRIRSQWIQR